MSKTWPPPRSAPRRGGWLSPAAYDALSRDEKRALWAERVAARAARRKRTAVSPFVLLWGAAALVGGVYGAGLFDRMPIPVRPIAKTAGDGEAAIDSSVGERIEFGACKWGGGSDCVVDGDTFWMHGQKVRMAGIDAPETHDYGCPEELALGERAADRLRELLNAGAVTLSSIDRDQDRYGRKLRNAAVGGRDVGEVLVSEGLAREYAGGRRPWC